MVLARSVKICGILKQVQYRFSVNFGTLSSFLGIKKREKDKELSWRVEVKERNTDRRIVVLYP